LALFLISALSLVWLAAGVEIWRLNDIAEHESYRDVENLAFAFAEEVNSTITTIDMSLIQLRSHWRRNRSDFPAIVGELNHELHGKVILQVSVTDAKGWLRFSSMDTAAQSIYLGDREHIRAQLARQGDRLFVSRPVLGRVSKLWTIQFTRPIYEADGRLVGVIVASVAPAYFARFYSSLDLGAGASIGLVRFDGTVIARTTDGAVESGVGRVLVGLPFEDRHAPFGTYRRMSRVDGVERYFAWRDLPDHDLLVTVGQSLVDANERYAQQKLNLVRAAIAVSLGFGFLGWAALTAADNRRRALRSLAAAEARLKLALKAGGEGLWDCDLINGRTILSSRAQTILDVNHSLLDVGVAGMRRCVHPDDLRPVWRALKRHFDGRSPSYVAEHRVRMGDGEWTWVLARGTVSERDSTGKPLHMVGTLSNIDARKNKEVHMRHLAHHDTLTGLPNRLLLSDRMRQAILDARRNDGKLGVIYFDLDRFKPVNDNFGHDVGDSLLQQLATRLRGALRASDTLARLGGDEFVILLPRCAGKAEIAKIAAKILKLLNREFVVADVALSISGSLGLSIFPDDAKDEDGLLRSADQAMYRAKAGGGGQVAHAWDIPIV
jgi:diguanylate cyclase (GGDEF)-like protein